MKFNLRSKKVAWCAGSAAIGVAGLVYFVGNGWQAQPNIPAAAAPALTAAVEAAALQAASIKPAAVDANKPLTFDTAMRLNSKRKLDAAPQIAGRFLFSGDGNQRSQAVQCLATAALYEAGDDIRGERAVMQVVLNRVRHPAYPNSVCGVVYQGAERTTGCQFTFACDGSLRRKQTEAAMRRAVSLAEEFLDGEVDESVGTATHYHADYVVPYWSASLMKIATVDRHIFYTFPGTAGSRRALVANYDPTAERSFKYVQSAISIATADSQGNGTPLEPGPELSGAIAPVRPALGIPSGFSSIELTKAEPAGRWAMKALAACEGRTPCHIYGVIDPSQGQNRPAFIFIRDRTGSDAALWDCNQTPRTESSQCLPEPGPVLDRLLRDRS